MNTKIIVQRLAKVVGAKPETSFAIIKEDSGALHSIKMGVATAVVVASVAPALAYGNATQMASLTEDMVTETQGYPSSGGNDVHIVPSAPTGSYSAMPPLTGGRSVAIYSPYDPGLWCKLSEQRNARELHAVHAARTAFQISDALLSWMRSFPSLN